jgi:DNA-binding YbaB/EbfC family protein
MNVAKLLQQAQKAQAEMQKALGELEVEGSAGGGLVKVRLNGLKDLKGVSVDATALAGEGAGLLEDLIVAAWEEATRQLDARTREIMNRFGLPPGMQGLL